MQVKLPDDLEAAVHELVATGQYESFDSVITEALERLLVNRIPADVINKMIAEADEDIRQGRVLTLEQACEQLGIDPKSL